MLRDFMFYVLISLNLVENEKLPSKSDHTNYEVSQ